MSITRPITRPIVRGITRGIVRGDLDADAAAYIAAVETALSSSISADQKNAINTFFKAGKSAGWYSSIKRLYLPIWGAAAPNAIDMISLASGTFNGIVSHAAGYIEGNASTGYFDTGTAANSILAASSGWMGALWITNPSNGQNGVYSGTTSSSLINYQVTPALDSYLASNTGRNTTSAGITVTEDLAGIFSVNRRSGVTRHRLTDSGGVSVSADYTQADTGTVPSGTFTWLARRRQDTGAIDQHHGARYGAMWLGNGVAGDLDESCSASLKTLWETCTGLTLP